MKKLVYLVLAVTAVFGLNLKALAVGSASFIVDDTAFAPNATFTVPVYENSDSDKVNVIEADLVYDPAQLKITGTDFSDSDFPGALKVKDTGSSISIVRYSFNGVTNHAKIGSITFTAIGSQPATSISFAPSSQIISNGKQIWNGVTAGASFKVVAPSPTPTPSPTSTPTQPAKATPTTVQPPAASPAKPLAASVSNPTIPHYFQFSSYPVQSSDNGQQAFILGCVLIIAAQLSRLFNLHSRVITRFGAIRQKRAIKK